MMPAALAGQAIDVDPGGGKHPLPSPFTAGVRILASERPWQLHPPGAASEVPFVLFLDERQGPGEVSLDGGGQYCDAVLVAFAGADDDLTRREVDVLDAKARALEQAQSRTVHQNRHQPRRPVKLSDDSSNLFPSEHDREPLRSLRADDTVEPGQLVLQHLAVEEQ